MTRPWTGGMSATARATAVIPANLRFEGVSCRYGAKEAVTDVSLEIREGEVVCLLGPSGCGKTTLLRLAAGIEPLTAGRILLDDRPIAWAGQGRRIPDGQIGLVFQDYALFPHLTILENVTFGLRSLSAREGREAAMVALGRVGLADRPDSYPHMLSGGEQQRVALARAVVPRPRVLLMDEPFSNLDSRLRDRVREETLLVLREIGATCLIVTHDPEEAMRAADRIALMRDGRVVQVGTAEQIFTEPVDLEAARFFCDLNEVPAAVTSGRVTSVFPPIPTLAPPGPAVLAIRPRGVGIAPAGHGLPGRLIQRRFLGDGYHLELAAQGLDAPLVARVRERPAVRPGQDVGILIDPQEALVFPRQGP